MDIEKIIPPSNRQHREGFSNISLIMELNTEEKLELENKLIDMLSPLPKDWVDNLIVETLAYLRSERSLPVLYDLLKNSKNDMTRLILASSIYQINNDDKMVSIAISSVQSIDDHKKGSNYVYSLICTFFYLSKFKNSEIKNIIKRYSNHSELLVSYNAKRFLVK